MTSPKTTLSITEFEYRLHQHQEALADALIARKLERVEREVLRLKMEDLELTNERLQRALADRTEDIQQLEERLRRALRSTQSMQEELRYLRQSAATDGRSRRHSSVAR